MAVPSSAVTAVYVIGQIVMIAGKDILTRARGALVFGRRVRILAANLAKEIPIRAEVLDVGTGDGSIAKAIALNRPDIKIEGDRRADPRPDTHIPVRLLDGEQIPLSEKAVDVVLFVDVLHHTSDARILLREAARVSRRHIVIKDHLPEGLFAKATSQAMDWVGNRRCSWNDSVGPKPVQVNPNGNQHQHE